MYYIIIIIIIILLLYFYINENFTSCIIDKCNSDSILSTPNGDKCCPIISNATTYTDNC